MGLFSFLRAAGDALFVSNAATQFLLASLLLVLASLDEFDSTTVTMQGWVGLSVVAASLFGFNAFFWANFISFSGRTKHTIREYTEEVQADAKSMSAEEKTQLLSPARSRATASLSVADITAQFERNRTLSGAHLGVALVAACLYLLAASEAVFTFVYAGDGGQLAHLDATARNSAALPYLVQRKVQMLTYIKLAWPFVTTGALSLFVARQQYPAGVLRPSKDA
jgi:hypothetical protein